MRLRLIGLGFVAAVTSVIPLTTIGYSAVGASLRSVHASDAYCRDAFDLSSFVPTSLQEWKEGLVSVKAIYKEAPSSTKKDVKSFMGDVQIIIKQGGTATHKQQKAFAKLDQTIAKKTNTVCKAWDKSHGVSGI